MKLKSTLSLILFSFLVSVHQTKAQSININNHTVWLNNNIDSLQHFLENNAKAKPLLFIKFNSRLPLKNASFAILHYVSNNTYLCQFNDSNFTNEAFTKNQILSWALLNPIDKLSPAIKLENLNELVKVLVKLAPNYNKAALQSTLTNTKAFLSAKQLWKLNNILSIEIPKNQIINLATSNDVIYIQKEYEPIALNTVAEAYTNTHIAHQPTALGGYGLLGNGVTVGVGDNSNPTHIDYIDRLMSFNPAVEETHGTHTTGTVGGNGIIDERYRGYAPECTLISDFFNGIIANASTYNTEFGMIATNNSYANVVNDCDYAGLYDLYSQYMDQQAFDIPDLLNIFAAGNDGYKNCGPYPIGYGTVVGAFSTAKNVLTVGAMGKNRVIIYNVSSKGPVKDGRLKPEITAMGYLLTSTSPINSYFTASGTSMATPNVTGAAVLIYQRYRQLHSNQNPENALVKLLLMNGADKVNNIDGPSYQYGFGIMNVGNSLKMMDNNQFQSGNIQNGQQNNFTITIPTNTVKAKIMLYWNDPAASAFSSNNLINDLDLTVSHNSTTYLPLVLDPSYSQIANPATPGQDHLNNVEQVTLDRPAAGSYTVNIEGYNIPVGTQKYYIAYSFLPDTLSFQYPLAKEVMIAGTSNYIYWQASDSTLPFTLSYSTDSGLSWTSINNNIASSKRAYYWSTPSTIASGKCLLKLTRGSETITSQPFTITLRATTTLAITNNQCPGNISFSWNALNGISHYVIFQKIGTGMQPIDTTSNLNYTITGLSPDSVYWVAIAPIIDNNTGIRSVAFSYQPNNGNCNNIAAHGDLRLNKISSPNTGRQYTSTALSINNPFQVTIQNIDDSTATNYSVHWKLNNGAWQSQSIQQTIAPTDTLTINLPNLNVSNVATYTLTVAVTNDSLSDPVSNNDTQTITFRQLSNTVIDIDNTPYLETFESFTPTIYTGDSILGIGNSQHWDFDATNSNGRLRSNVNNEITIQGNKSISIDNKTNEQNPSQNYLTGTFNLSSYTPSSAEVRCDFDYKIHGVPKFDTGNQIWVRGSDTDPWLSLYKYNIDSMNPGIVQHSPSLSLSAALSAGGQTFSTSTQIRFCQRDTSLISTNDYGNGFTLDNVKLYLVNDDIQLISIDSLQPFNCALSNNVPLKIKVQNAVQHTIYNIPISFKVDNNSVVTEMIDSIQGYDTLDFEFQNTMDLSTTTLHTISVWSSLPTDSYHQNDSINNYEIHNMPVISNFPYLENFENNNGDFYTEGANNTWQYGTPQSINITHAASGSKAWKTNLTGYYNNNSTSYLYSPCFNISNLSNPTLSFSLATDIENNPNPNSVYDQAYVEYTIDGVQWTKLNGTNQYNWYNNTNANAWTKQGETWWHVATTSLPNASGTIAFRFVLKSDPGTTFDGIAIDDIHIYDYEKAISDSNQILNITQNVNANDTTEFLYNNQLVASMFNTGATLNNVKLNRYTHTNLLNEDSSQAILPESFAIVSPSLPSDTVDIQLYILDSVVKALREYTGCTTCTPPNEIYQLGINKYDNTNSTLINDSLMDNIGGTWTFIPYNSIQYIPYGKGYIAQFKVNNFSEFWFSTASLQTTPLDGNFLQFSAIHWQGTLAKLSWENKNDINQTQYKIERAGSDNQFHTIATIQSLHQNNKTYNYIDTPNINQPYTLYRLLNEDLNGNIQYSKIYKLEWQLEHIRVYPNPVKNNSITIDLGNLNIINASWQITDITGRKVNSGEIRNPLTQIPINQWGLASGTYMLRIINGNEKLDYKVIYNDQK